jgi:capsid protein
MSLINSILGKFRVSSWMNAPGGSSYEGAKTNQTRSTLSLKVQTAKLDLDKTTRIELIRKGRYLHRNSPVVRGLIERLVNYTIGTGIHPSPISSDDTFNDLALAEFKRWSLLPDIESRNTFATTQQILFRSMLIDGDIFAAKVIGGMGFPRLQMIESQDMTSNRTYNDNNVDGVILDEYGRPTTYVFRETQNIDAENVIHFMIPERAGQKRGVSILHAVINTAHDIDDILALEKAAAKEGASKTDIIKTASGELPTNDYIGESVKPASEVEGTEEITRYYREAFGPEAKVLKQGDEFTPYVSNRPSQAFQGFIDFLCEQICFGAGLPPSLLLGTKIGGADTRREVATAQRVIDQWQQIFASRLQHVFEYVIQSAILSGRISNPPFDWKAVEWQFPPKLTVDSGREANADREDVKLGLLTRREYFSRWGLDWKEQTEQKAKEAAFLKELSEKYGVDRGEIALLDPNELAAKEAAPEEKKPEPKFENV